MPRHMRTSVDLPDSLLRRARKLARERGTTLRQILIEGLTATLERKAPVQKYRLKDRSYGDGGLVNGLSWSDTERLDELAYGDRG
jgi:hypothetical protein